MAIPAINVLGNPNITEGNFQIAIEDLRKSVIGSGKAYDSANTYSQYDTCVSGGIVYYSKINSNTGNTPAVNTNWGLVSELIKLIESPITNSIPKINANGTIGNSSILEDANGNISVAGNTLSAWGNIIKGLSGNNDSGIGFLNSLPALYAFANTYHNGTDWIYKTNSPATYCDQYNGSYSWKTAPSGTAGNPITWTNAMTLDSIGDITVPHTYSNTTASAANMFIDSSGKFFRSTSSKKYKTDIETIDNSYVEKFFDNARPIYYKSLSDNDNPNWGYWGFIAEEIAEFDKRLVHWRYQTKEVEVEKERVLESETIEKYIEVETVNDESKPMIAEGVMYERITVLLTAKVQEQQKIIDNLISRLEILESK